MQQASELACLVALVAPNAGNLDATIRMAIRDVDPSVPAMNLTTMEEILDNRWLIGASTPRRPPRSRDWRCS
jgi:hypothetical protein